MAMAPGLGCLYSLLRRSPHLAPNRSLVAVQIVANAAAHVLPGLHGIKAPKNDCTTESLGDTARIDGLKSFRGSVLANMNGVHHSALSG